MNVRCKYVCNSVTKRVNYSDRTQFAYDFEFSVVTGGSEENKKYYLYTPNGNIKVSAFRDDVFVPGEEYYVDFSPAKV